MRSFLVPATFVIVFFICTDAEAQTMMASGEVCDRYHLSAVTLSSSDQIKLDKKVNEINLISTEHIMSSIKQNIERFLQEPPTDTRNAKMRYFVYAICVKMQQDPTRDGKEKSKRLTSIDDAQRLIRLERYKANERQGSSVPHHHPPEDDIVQPRKPAGEP
jgi:hypothetical protein